MRLQLEELEQRRLLAGVITQAGYFDTWNGGIVPSTDVAGVAFHAPSGHLYLADSEINELPEFQGDNIFSVSPDGQQLFQEITSNHTEPTGITYNEFDGFFYVTKDTSPKTITRYDINLDNPLLVISPNDDVLGATDLEGIAANPSTGFLYVADGMAGGLQILTYNSNLEFQSVFSVADRMSDAEGIAFHPPSNHLFVVNGVEDVIFEFTLDGIFVEQYDLSGLSPAPISPQGLTFGPTSDPFDDPSTLALYVADLGLDNIADGGVYETIINGQSPQNMAPLVNAGQNQTIFFNGFPATMNLDATVSDDGFPDPPGTLTTSWSQVSGPAVTFADAAAIDTTVTLSAPGTYILRLTADDGELVSSNDTTLVVMQSVEVGTITESGGSTDVTEGGVTDTYSVVLDSQPAANVSVTINTEGQSAVSAVDPGLVTILAADFDTGEDGFGYADDSFRETAAPLNASGVRLPSGGFSGGGLQITLGGVDSNTVLGMSGGWQRSFALAEPTDVTFSFKYNLTQVANYESDEFSQAIVSIDGVLYGDGSNDYIAQLVGDGNGGGAQSTGWQNFELNTGILSAGTHTITIGAYNNKKSWFDETTELRIDDVLGVTESFSALNFTPANWNVPQTVTVTAVDDTLVEGIHSSTITHSLSSQDPEFNTGTIESVLANITDNDAQVIISESGGSTDVTEGAATDNYEIVLSTAPTADVTVTVNPDGQSVISTTVPGLTTILAADFETGDDGFGYADDGFRGTTAPLYATGVRVPSGGFSGGGLQITLGGIDSATVLGMSGGWRRSFTLDEPTDVTFSFKYNLVQAANYESDEFSQALASIDGVLYGDGSNDYIAQLVGDAAGGGPQSTGWQTFELNAGTLSAGTHTLAIGAYNNKKTFTDETTELRIDDVLAVTESSNSTLTFTPSNWNVAQAVTVTAVDDAVVEGPHISTITHTSSSTDPSYDGIAIGNAFANITDNDAGSGTISYVSFSSTATVLGLTVENEDVVAFDGTDFTMFFDGSDVGISGTNVDALAVISANEILFSFASSETIPGIAGTVEDSDIVKFTATQLGDTTSGTFELFFRGGEVGLSPGTEDVVAIDLHDDGRLLVSTKASYSVPGVAGRDEDLIAFTPNTPGDYAAGTWEMYFDGSDVELGVEDVNGVALDSFGDINLSTTSTFLVTGGTGENEDVLVFLPAQLGAVTTGAYASTLMFDGSQFGLSANDVNAFDVSNPAVSGGAGDALQITRRTAVSVQSFAVEEYAPKYDVSGNGEVTALDALQVINSLSVLNAGLLSDRQIDEMDVNEDGKLSALDALLVVNYLSHPAVPQAASVARTIDSPADPDAPQLVAIQELMNETQIDLRLEVDLDDAISADIMTNNVPFSDLF